MQSTTTTVYKDTSTIHVDSTELRNHCLHDYLYSIMFWSHSYLGMPDTVLLSLLSTALPCTRGRHSKYKQTLPVSCLDPVYPPTLLLLQKQAHAQHSCHTKLPATHNWIPICFCSCWFLYMKCTLACLLVHCPHDIHLSRLNLCQAFLYSIPTPR